MSQAFYETVQREQEAGMNQEYKALWLAGLRSGRYEQGRGRLREGSKFCCLGVCEDVMMPFTHNRWNGNDICTEDGRLAHQGHLLEITVSLLGVDANKIIPELTDRKGWTVQLTGLNDAAVEPLTFAQIADVIEYFY